MHRASSTSIHNTHFSGQVSMTRPPTPEPEPIHDELPIIDDTYFDFFVRMSFLWDYLI